MPEVFPISGMATRKTAKTRRAPQARTRRAPRSAVLQLRIKRKKDRLARFRRTMRYEIGNLFTHSFGLGLAVCGTIFLLIKSAGTDGLRLFSYVVYGASIVALYASSSLYHSLWDARSKKVFRRLDHSAIYMAIAGTFTPVTLLVIQGVFGWTMFIVIWAFALVGILLKVVFPHKYAKASVAAYILMGWIGLAAVKPVYAALPGAALILFLAGGLFYTGGTVFYSRRLLPFNHMIWHFFVLAGSVCHFLALYLYV